MKKHIFDWKMWLITGVFGLLGIVVTAILMNDFEWARDSVVACCILSSLFFAVPLVTAWLGMRLSLLLTRRRFEIVGRVGGIGALLTALVLCIIFSTFAQIIYAIEPKTETEIIPGETDALYDGTHIVILMDYSASMDGVIDSCAEAAVKLINGLDESCYVQFVAFTNIVADRNISDFLPMTAANKSTLANMIPDVIAWGGTDFDRPLTIALDTLEANRDPRYRPVIIMLTDGEDYIDDTVKTRIKSFSDLSLYTVRITDDQPGVGDNALTQELLDLADEDFTIPYNSRGKIDVDDVLAAFSAALTTTTDPVIVTHTGIGFGTDLLYDFGNIPYWWRVPAVILMFTAYGILLSLAYYGSSLGGWRIILNVASGIVFALLWMVIPIGTPIFLLVPYSLIHIAALTVYEVKED